jgi:hypothetical protein
MPDLLTPQALATGTLALPRDAAANSADAPAGPLVLETFVKHYLGPKRSKDDEARDDLMFDEGKSPVNPQRGKRE